MGQDESVSEEGYPSVCGKPDLQGKGILTMAPGKDKQLIYQN
jgi:hypothetical protein